MCRCVPRYFLLHPQISAKETSFWGIGLARRWINSPNVPASQLASASAASCSFVFTYGFTNWGTVSLTVCPERLELAIPIVGAGGNAQWAHRTARRTARTIAQSE
ncbi:hypothetical protein B0O95_105210 [Mycetohabitans endofungorum]|uniref:Uncharacterized protein n=1 Tax=Mycetohabitans endofungorum TaxID=417203 RepID=A0A2P5KBD6_9BURK|nr:hypothetical protein B0O95_105210 [Mycetohabitans endofungorum]